MKVTWTELAVPGLFLSGGASVRDERGAFTKILAETDDPWPSPFVVEELFWTSSIAGVMRGLHFQLPPFAARKLVYVVHGAIRDFVVDLRVGSPMERQLAEGVIQGSAMQLSIRNQVFGGMDQFRDMLSIAPDEIRQQIERVRGEGAVATLSFTSTTTCVSSARQRMPTQPSGGVNLIAFFNRFQNTCCRRGTSALTQ